MLNPIVVVIIIIIATSMCLGVDVSLPISVPDAVDCFIWQLLLQSDGDSIHDLIGLYAMFSFKFPSYCRVF